MSVQITEPGVYPDLPEDVYHADPVPAHLGGSLSVSGAKRLLPPSCPARFRWERDHGRPPKPEFDFGHAAHRLILGVGQEVVVVEAEDWRGKAAREQRDAAYAGGKTPLLAAEWQAVQDMATALRAHPIANLLFRSGVGQPEVSLFWQDPSEVWLRGRLDWLPASTSGRLIVPDYKTAASADPDRFARSAADFGYHMQAAWYLDGLGTLGLDTDAAFVFVVQEKTPPYLVNVVELDDYDLRIGRHLNRQAIDLYAECLSRNEWPGYATDVSHVSLPAWYRRAFTEDVA